MKISKKYLLSLIEQELRQVILEQAKKTPPAMQSVKAKTSPNQPKLYQKTPVAAKGSNTKKSNIIDKIKKSLPDILKNPITQAFGKELINGFRNKQIDFNQLYKLVVGIGHVAKYGADAAKVAMKNKTALERYGIRVTAGLDKNLSKPYNVAGAKQDPGNAYTVRFSINF